MSGGSSWPTGYRGRRDSRWIWLGGRPGAPRGDLLAGDEFVVEPLVEGGALMMHAAHWIAAFGPGITTGTTFRSRGACAGASP